MSSDPLAVLADDVVALTGRPLDRWAVAATLESRGVRDVDAAERFGLPDVFALADAVFARALAAVPAGPRPMDSAAAADPPLLERRKALRSYLRGGFFFVPLSMQMLSLVLLGFSQWASLRFSLAQASVVAVAVGASFVLTAGTSQALGYLAPLFDAPGKHMLTERVTYRVLAAGLCGALVGGAALASLALLTGAYPAERLAVGMAYFALLAALWLVTAALYASRSYGAMATATMAGIAVTWTAHDGLGSGIYVSHWTGLAATIAVAGGLGARRLRRAAQATRGDRRLARLPRIATLRRRAAPYAVYGTLYFTFLFVDRAIAWSGGRHPLPVWFSVRYEIGLDWALLSVVLGMAFLEVLVTALPEISDRLQERTSARRLEDHNRGLTRCHRRALAAITALLLAGVGCAWLAGHALTALGIAGELRGVTDDPVTRSVFVWGAAGYVLLVVALANAVLLFSLSRPWPMVAALVPSIVVDVVVGLILSRSGEPWHAVVGLTAGALVLALASGLAARRALHQADFAYYAGF